jgi:hypothetical protein
MNDQNLEIMWYCRHQGAKQTENFDKSVYCVRDTRWRSWLRHWAIRRKVAVSIPVGVTGIFN